MTPNLLEIKGLTKSYDGAVALRNLDLTLGAGHIVGLLGPNGSGKTTLMKILTGMIRNYKGQVLIDGQEPGIHTRSIVSYLPDRTIFSSWMRPVDVMDLYEDFFEDFDRAKCEDMLNRLGLNFYQKVRAMSKGMVEKFQLCLTMSRRARLYVLDEPIGGVDPAARDYILSTILNNYNENGTVLLSTHLIGDVEQIFDEAIFLKHGEVVLHGEADAIRCEKGQSLDQIFREVFRC